MKESRILEIPIELIKSLDNSRVRIENQELSTLMEDIKHRGLLQPIGLIQDKSNYIIRFGNRRLEACKKLGWKSIPAIVEDKELDFESFLADNVAENFHRVDLTPIELAKVILQLKERKMSISEICIALSIPKSKVVSCLNISGNAPEKFKSKIEYIRNPKNKKGKISISVANEILQSKRNGKKENIDALFEFAQTEELSAQDVKIINRLISQGKTFDEAKTQFKKYLPVTCDLVFNKEEFMKYNLPIKTLLLQFIKGDISPNSKLLQ